MTDSPDTTPSEKRTKQIELSEWGDAVAALATEPYHFCLFVAGATQRSAQAIAAVKEACERHLPGRYMLEVIDIYQLPERARDEQIIATPTLVRRLPTPLRRMIGDLSDLPLLFLGPSPDLTREKP